MIYYRVARKSEDSGWNWLSTKMNSLGAVCGFLQFYSFIPLTHLRVFMTSSRDDLNISLDREEIGNVVFVSAEQFLMQSKSFLKKDELSEQDSLAIMQWAANQSPEEPQFHKEPSGENVGLLERRRLEIESMAGDDHDQPYLFGLPTHIPTMLAWLRLREKRLNGEIGS